MSLEERIQRIHAAHESGQALSGKKRTLTIVYDCNRQSQGNLQDLVNHMSRKRGTDISKIGEYLHPLKLFPRDSKDNAYRLEGTKAIVKDQERELRRHGNKIPRTLWDRDTALTLYTVQKFLYLCAQDPNIKVEIREQAGIKNTFQRGESTSSLNHLKRLYKQTATLEGFIQNYTELMNGLQSTGSNQEMQQLKRDAKERIIQWDNYRRHLYDTLAQKTSEEIVVNFRQEMATGFGHTLRELGLLNYIYKEEDEHSTLLSALEHDYEKLATIEDSFRKLKSLIRTDMPEKYLRIQDVITEMDHPLSKELQPIQEVIQTELTYLRSYMSDVLNQYVANLETSAGCIHEKRHPDTTHQILELLSEKTHGTHKELVEEKYRQIKEQTEGNITESLQLLQKGTKVYLGAIKKEQHLSPRMKELLQPYQREDHFRSNYKNAKKHLKQANLHIRTMQYDQALHALDVVEAIYHNLSSEASTNRRLSQTKAIEQKKEEAKTSLESDIQAIEQQLPTLVKRSDFETRLRKYQTIPETEKTKTIIHYINDADYFRELRSALIEYKQSSQNLLSANKGKDLSVAYKEFQTIEAKTMELLESRPQYRESFNSHLYTDLAKWNDELTSIVQAGLGETS
ncbi:MAG: hypothetical protein ACQESG_05500 [Nanobdellota archaeon]